MTQPMDAVAVNLSRLRAERKLSFDQLSARTGVSKSMLRQIETGKSSPTIATIWKIANGLKVSFTSLLRLPDRRAKVASFTGSTPLTAESDRYRLFPMIPFDPQQAFETYYMEIDPDTVFRGEAHQGEVYEYLFVLNGRVEIEVDDRQYRINGKEFLRFRADCPHIYKNIGDGTASVIMQITYL
ncbi:MAG: XRE family transcriptional regulator [Desulfobacterales bacterium]|nr:XRE family transcriptional regulator [Desulfobacterales bacterium]